MKARRTVLFTATLAVVALSVPVACDDPELPIDEEVLLSDDADAVDLALAAAEEAVEAGSEVEVVEDLADPIDPSLAINVTTVWGVEFNGTDTRLFRHNLDGTDNGPTPIVLKYNNANAQIDGLAQNNAGTLYAFVIAGTQSQLVTISQAGATTKVGSPLTGRIRGATFDAAGALRAIDVANKKLLTISTSTGLATATASLTLNGAAFTPSDSCDLALHPDGGLRLVSGINVYKVSGAGALTLEVALSTAYDLTGAAFNVRTVDQMVALNAKTTDSLVRANLRTKAVAVVRSDIIAGHDATRGDLATLPFFCTTAVTIPNGGFEQPDTAQQTSIGAGSTALTGWAVGLGGVDVVDKSLWQPAAGSQSLDLNAANTGSAALATGFASSVGVTYRLAFAMAGNTGGAPAVKTMQVYGTGGSVVTESFDATGKTAAAMGWSERAYYWKATATSTKFEFKSTITGWFGPTLDNVRVFRCNR